MAARVDGRQPNELRPCRIERGYSKYAEGSCLIEIGETRIICTASDPGPTLNAQTTCDQEI